MFRESSSYGSTVVRHPDGSINFDAYRAAARRERQAAIVSSIEGAARATNALLHSLGIVLAGRSAKHPAHHAKCRQDPKVKRSASAWMRPASEDLVLVRPPRSGSGSS